MERGEVFLVKKEKRYQLLPSLSFKRLHCMFIIISFAYALCSMCFCYYNYEKHELKL